MPYLFRRRLTKVSDLDDDSYMRFKLPETGVFTAFEMRINCDRHANRASHNTVYTLEDCITRIEMLRGGGEVLHSLSGLQEDVVNYWAFKRPTARRYGNIAGRDNFIHLFIMGGRHLWDFEYAFDMSRLKQAYLEYTYNLKEGTAEYFKADDHDVTLYAHQWMGSGVPTPKGFIRSKQLSRYTTTAADTLKEIDVPTGNPILRIGVQSLTRATTVYGATKEIEVRVNEGQYSPVKITSVMDWCLSEIAQYGLFNSISGLDYPVTGQDTDLPYYFSYNQHATLASYAAAAGNVGTISYHWAEPIRFREGASVVEQIFEVRGGGFRKCARIGFDMREDMADALHLGSNEKLDLVLTETAASKDVAVIVQDVVSY